MKTNGKMGVNSHTPTVKVLKGYEGELEFQRAGDGGIDIIANEDIEIKPFETKIVSTGLQVKLPDGWYMDVRGRSGLTAKGIIVQLGLVDSNYTGDVGVIITNLHNVRNLIRTCQIDKGDRIAQIVFHKVNQFEFEEVDELPKTNRGSDRLGSSGK